MPANCATSATKPGEQRIGAEAFAFAAVDGFLQTELEARALSFALSHGWIDRLVEGPAPGGALQQLTPMPPASLALLLGLLRANGVVEAGEPLTLTSAFRDVLGWRDLLEARLWFANTVAPDVHERFDALLTDLPRFMDGARVFELFRYDRCFEVTPENIEATRRWVTYTTTLTRYEAGAALDCLDLDAHRSMLDVGGNSGEFARQACARAPNLRATVFDLPVVCALGREHLNRFPERERVAFVAGDLRAEPLPRGPDLVSFKSVLHDWPDPFAREFLGKAAAVLRPGGELLIFERLPMQVTERLPYAAVANLVFLPFFRPTEAYLAMLQDLGVVDLTVETVMLDIPFQLIRGRKPA